LRRIYGERLCPKRWMSFLPGRKSRLDNCCGCDILGVEHGTRWGTMFCLLYLHYYLIIIILA
jgi:hypothetical protein